MWRLQKEVGEDDCLIMSLSKFGVTSISEKLLLIPKSRVSSVRCLDACARGRWLSESHGILSSSLQIDHAVSWRFPYVSVSPTILNPGRAGASAILCYSRLYLITICCFQDQHLDGATFVGGRNGVTLGTKKLGPFLFFPQDI